MTARGGAARKAAATLPAAAELLRLDSAQLMRGSPRCARRRALCTCATASPNEWAAVAMGKAEWQKLAGIDYSTPDRRAGTPDADAAPGDLPVEPLRPAGGGATSERTREVAQVLPARRSLPGTTCTAWAPWRMRSATAAAPPRSCGAGRRLACRLSSRCARTRPAPGAASGSAAAPRRTRCASARRASSAPSRPGAGCLRCLPRRRGRWSSSWRWWLDHEHAKAIRGTAARAATARAGERL